MEISRGMGWRCNHQYHHASSFRFISPKSKSSNTKTNLRPSNNISFAAAAAAAAKFSMPKRCQKCGGKGAIDCPGCKGTGKNKKNGNIFERWKCFQCQGFGLKSCPDCGNGGLTPEQRGER